MPTYEYQCPKCGLTIQMQQSIFDMTSPICMTCLNERMSRGPGGGIAVHFKGSGFYETDYKNK